MLSPKSYLLIRPLATPGASAMAYVPMVVVARALSFLRTLLVARILAAEGQQVFGYYQPALELVNPIVALVLFGASDVAERYVSRLERDHGHTGLRGWLVRQWARLSVTAFATAAIMVLISPWL